jgi:hypothetical protein
MGARAISFCDTPSSISARRTAAKRGLDSSMLPPGFAPAAIRTDAGWVCSMQVAAVFTMVFPTAGSSVLLSEKKTMNLEGALPADAYEASYPPKTRQPIRIAAAFLITDKRARARRVP